MSTNVRTNSVRGAFVNLKEARAFGDSDKKKFSINLLFDPSKPKDAETLLALRKAIKEAVEKKFGTDPKNWPNFAKRQGFKWSTYLSPDGRDGFPLRDGNGQNYEGFAGMVSLNVSSDRPVQVLDRNRNLLEGDELNACRSGCKFSAVVNPYAWEYQKNKGVSFGLMAVMLVLDDGTYWGNNVDGRKAFSDFDDEDLSIEDEGFADDAQGADDPNNYDPTDGF